MIGGLLAGYAVALPLGPIGSYLITLTARSSLRIGAAAALGVAVMDAGYALLAVLGGTAASAALAPLAGPLRWSAVAILLVLASRALTGVRPTADEQGPKRPPPSATIAFVRFLALTAINPTTLISFTALVIGARLGSTGHPATRALFVLGTFAASASWQLCLAAAGAVLGRLLNRRRAVLGYCSAALLGTLAVILAIGSLG